MDFTLKKHLNLLSTDIEIPVFSVFSLGQLTYFTIPESLFLWVVVWPYWSLSRLILALFWRECHTGTRDSLPLGSLPLSFIPRSRSKTRLSFLRYSSVDFFSAHRNFFFFTNYFNGIPPTTEILDSLCVSFSLFSLSELTFSPRQKNVISAMWRGSLPAPPALLLLLLVGIHGALGAPPVRRKNDKTPGYPVIMSELVILVFHVPRVPKS